MMFALNICDRQTDRQATVKGGDTYDDDVVDATEPKKLCAADKT